MVNVVDAEDPDGVTVAGLKAQETPAASPEQVKLMAALNPFCGVTVTITVPCLPDATLSNEGETLSANDGGVALTLVFNKTAGPARSGTPSPLKSPTAKADSSNENDCGA